MATAYCEGKLCACGCRLENDARLHEQSEQELRDKYGWVDSDFIERLEVFAQRAEHKGCPDRAQTIRAFARIWQQRFSSSSFEPV